MSNEVLNHSSYFLEENVTTASDQARVYVMKFKSVDSFQPFMNLNQSCLSLMSCTQ